ncbi:MAG: class I SAM-dependent methyltransferase [Myxococcota bacterium]
MNITELNGRAWDRWADGANPWTTPADGAAVARARAGNLIDVRLTPTRPVPSDWLPDPWDGVAVLALAAGGGQQGPLLAARGAEVTVLDVSETQLERDRQVARREQLSLHTVRGDMTCLDAFADETFDLCIHPVSNLFVPDPRPVWREVARVLRPSGQLLAGFVHPFFFLFDDDALARGDLEIRYRVPYSDLEQLPPAKLEAFIADGQPVCFGHTLSDQIGGQLAAGLHLLDLYEDGWGADDALDQRIDTFVATRAVKPGTASR